MVVFLTFVVIEPNINQSIIDKGRVDVRVAKALNWNSAIVDWDNVVNVEILPHGGFLCSSLILSEDAESKDTVIKIGNTEFFTRWSLLDVIHLDVVFVGTANSLGEGISVLQSSKIVLINSILTITNFLNCYNPF